MTIGRTLTRGMGTGGETALARKAISEEKDNVRKTLEGVDLIFLLAGLGEEQAEVQLQRSPGLLVKQVLLYLPLFPCHSVGKKGDMLRPKIHWPNLGSLQMR